MQCPACGGKRHTKHEKFIQVYTCKKCGCLHGSCYKGESYLLVKPYFHPRPEEVTGERYKPYDLTVLGSAGIERRHGWYDTETRLVVQVG